MDVPSVPVTPEPALGVVPAGTVRAGHAVAQAPVQLVPAAKVYRGIPALFSRIVPLLVEADFTVALAAVVAGEAVPEFPVVGGAVVALLGLEEPHAARARATTARAPTAVRGRARPFIRAPASVAPRRGVVATSV